ncbi:transcription factor bHLH62 [Senna tora]|uniref:Transcription factor bHLH62 n=1 Tax=Senna tora TaxID=362788 RepID=A0A834T5D2_9FABA|nr:transcription factor bHLH62 [Senna tora]
MPKSSDQIAETSLGLTSNSSPPITPKTPSAVFFLKRSVCRNFESVGRATVRRAAVFFTARIQPPRLELGSSYPTCRSVFAPPMNAIGAFRNTITTASIPSAANTKNLAKKKRQSLSLDAHQTPLTRLIGFPLAASRVTGKALMFDEIINYVQSLQHQVEILQSNNVCLHPIFALDSSAQAFYENQQNPGIHNNTLNGTMTHTTVDPLETASLCQNLGVQMQLPFLNVFTTEAAPQFPVTFCEDDLYTIVQQGFGQTASGKFPSQSHDLNDNYQSSIDDNRPTIFLNSIFGCSFIDNRTTIFLKNLSARNQATTLNFTQNANIDGTIVQSPNGVLGSVDYKKEERLALDIKCREAPPRFVIPEPQKYIVKIFLQISTVAYSHYLGFLRLLQWLYLVCNQNQVIGGRPALPHPFGIDQAGRVAQNFRLIAHAKHRQRKVFIRWMRLSGSQKMLIKGQIRDGLSKPILYVVDTFMLVMQLEERYMATLLTTMQ